MEDKPYYETENGKLFNGDCLKIMQDLIDNGVKVDSAITDPPYGMSFQSKHRKEKHLKIDNDNNLEWLPEFVELIYTLLNEDTHAYIFCSWHKVDKFKQEIEKHFKIKNIIIWEKNNTGMGDLEGAYAPKYEFLIYAQKGSNRKLNGSRDAEIIKAQRTQNELHPTQKPTEIYTYLLDKSTKKGESVLDCFSGSGTLAEACEEKGRKWICIEKEKSYCDITVKRLQNIQESLF